MNGTDGKIVIFGCGGHSRSVTDVLLSGNPGASLVFVDDHARDGEQIYGFHVHREYVLGDERFFLAIGDNEARKRKLEETGEKNLISVISGTAHRGHRSTVGSGCFIGNFCHIGPEAIIGKNTILNTASVIEHEVAIGSHCHIGPNATISGRCTIGDLVFVGVGATVKDYLSICANVIIGAGATVVKNITEPGTYVGTPARRIK
jgi:UDP-N-acetylbacillosamine N-acetyltransferase